MEMKACVETLGVSQTEYIRRAIALMNRETKHSTKVQRLQAASMLVRDESLKVSKEFGDIEHDPDA